MSKPYPVYLFFFKKWYNETAVSFGFLNTRMTLRPFLKAPPGKSCGIKWLWTIRGLEYELISSGVPSSRLHTCPVYISLFLVFIKNVNMLLNQWVPENTRVAVVWNRLQHFETTCNYLAYNVRNYSMFDFSTDLQLRFNFYTIYHRSKIFS